ncbi:MAG: response regulator [Candidatus Omnitrophica bacterium]|nr:response regulator [Candidatus Omnitrophota bacterium]
MPKSILLIDDDKLILVTLKRLLIREGYQVVTALNGEAALRKMKDDGFSLIISDIKMPQMDGVETVRKIREFLIQHGKHPIPEVFITGYAKEEICQKARELNAAAYLEKPFDVKALQDTVRKLTENHDYYN